MSIDPLDIAIDIGPLYGHRTGVGVAVDGMTTALGDRDDVRLSPYLVSFRSSAEPGHRKLPLPGIIASHAWSHADRPRADRWLAGADVVHGTNYVAPPSQLPTVVSVYDCWFLQHPELAAPVVRRAGAVLRRRAAAGAWIHTSSDATTERARDLLATDRVRTIALGAPEVPSTDELEAAEGKRRPAVAGDVDGRPFVVCVATEERRKGIPLLIDAFAELTGRHDDVALVLAGAPGDDTDAITDAVGRAGDAAAGRIHRLGAIDDEAKRWLVRHAALLAYPSIDEGFGFPVLEAQALGTPVVATGVGSVTEVAGDAAELVDGRDPATFAAAIDRVLGDGVRRLDLIASGYRNLTRFRWETTAEQLTELYRDAVADR